MTKKQNNCPPGKISRGKLCVEKKQINCPPVLIKRRNECFRKRSTTTGTWILYSFKKGNELRIEYLF